MSELLHTTRIFLNLVVSDTERPSYFLWGSPNSSLVLCGLRAQFQASLLSQSLVSAPIFFLFSIPIWYSSYGVSLGAISDSSTSKYRRRYWIALSTAVLMVSTLTLAYCQDIASFFVDFFHIGAGDWDPKQHKQV